MEPSPPSVAPRRTNRWRQFSLRSLLFLTLLCGIALIAWLRLVEPYRKQAQELKAIAELKLKPRIQLDPAGPGWVAGLLGKDEVADVSSLSHYKADDDFARRLPTFLHLRDLNLNGGTVTDAGIARFGNLRALTALSLNSQRLTDAGLKSLPDLRELTSLNLGNNKLTDAGLVQLRGMTKLKTLDLSRTQVTSAGMEHLQPLTQLTSLRLSQTPITDEGIAKLAGLKKLQELYLEGTNITDESLKVFQELPNLDTLYVQGTKIKPLALAKAIPDLYERRVKRAIDMPVDMGFIETPLADVIVYLRELARVSIHFDRGELDNVGVGSDTPVTFSCKQQPLSQALKDVLAPLKLDHAVWEGMIIIKPAGAPLWDPLLTVEGLPASAELSEALVEPTVLEFVETPLDDVCKYLSRLHRCQIEVDREAIPESWGRIPITMNLRGLPLQVSLKLLFANAGLRGSIDGDTILLRPGKSGIPSRSDGANPKPKKPKPKPKP